VGIIQQKLNLSPGKIQSTHLLKDSISHSFSQSVTSFSLLEQIVPTSISGLALAAEQQA
jgi:hypothetical protein